MFRRIGNLAGWQPNPAYLKAGRVVRWVSSRNAMIFIMDENSAVTDSVSMIGGTATRSFTKPGLIHYCQLDCWDPPDFGTIHVQ